jgi:hypothetical protein
MKKLKSSEISKKFQRGIIMYKFYSFFCAKQYIFLITVKSKIEKI